MEVEFLRPANNDIGQWNLIYIEILSDLEHMYIWRDNKQVKLFADWPHPSDPMFSSTFKFEFPYITI